MTEELKARIAQINAGTAPAGYKKTKVGIVPEEWDIIKAKKVFRNRSDKKHDGTLEVLSVTQDRGVIPRSQVDIDIKYDKESTSSYKRVYTGDFVISLRSFQGGIEYSEYNGIVSPAYTVIEAFTPIGDDYYRAYFKSPTYIQRLNTAVYGIRDGKNISFEDFSQIYIPFPPLPEQQIIAEILTAQDEVIALMQKQIELKQQQKKYLMQKLLSGEVRVGSGEWKTVRLNEICTFINGRAYKQEELLDEGKYPVLRVGNLFTKGDWYYSDLELSDEKYIDNGDLIFAWSASFSPFIWNGSKVIYHYHIWKIDDLRGVDKMFLYLSLQYDVEKMQTQTQGGTMAHITKETMEKRKIALPPLPEQEKIAEILSAQDKEIELLQQQLALEQQKKKALMQLLLTGKVRVKT